MTIPFNRIPPTVVAAIAAIAMLIGSGCTRDTRADQPATKRGVKTDSAAGQVAGAADPYTIGRAGSAAVAVAIGKDTVSPPNETGTCEVSPEPQATTRDAVVWLDGIHEGKALPRERRYQLVSSGCSLSPRVQAVAIGGGINVYNDDKVLHRLVFLRGGTNDTLQTMPFTNDNEIVATDRLTKTAGLVEVHCAQHPQERAYIMVFDQPYFAVGTAGETLTLDGVPEGDYQLMTWREGMTAPASVPAKVGASGQTTVVVK